MIQNFRGHRKEQGFTLLEMIAVIASITILAGIAIGVFVRQVAINADNALKADLLSATTNVEEAKVDNGGKYPLELPEDKISLTSEGASLGYSYPYDRLGYCLSITSKDKSKTYYKSSNSSEITETSCKYEYSIPSTKLIGRLKGYAPSLSWNAVPNATSYEIYKNNILAKTVNVENNSSETQSLTLPALNPGESATYYVVVSSGASKSAPSNSLTLTAPAPKPTTPVIKLLGSFNKDAVTKTFNIGWSSIKYSKGYEVYDMAEGTPIKIATLAPGSGSYAWDVKRGETKKIAVRAVNDTGVSAYSNTITLNSDFDTPRINSAETDPETAKARIVFHRDNGDGSVTPDYGWPNSRIELKVVEKVTGKVVLDKKDIATTEYTTESLNRVDHIATIIVTTSTGQVLPESAPVSINFPKPNVPNAPEELGYDAEGDANLSPNRLTWNSVGCDSSDAQYYVTHGADNSGWISNNEFNIPQEWLAEGRVESFSVKARCVNSNGTSAESKASTISFTTGLYTPEPPKNVSAVERGDTIKWDAVTCPAGATPEYTVTQGTRNGESNSEWSSPILRNTTSYKIPGIQPGEDQQAFVSARCVKIEDGQVTGSSLWSDDSDSADWTTLFGIPQSPQVKVLKKEYTSTTEVKYTLGWQKDKWGTTYTMYSKKKIDPSVLPTGDGYGDDVTTTPTADDSPDPTNNPTESGEGEGGEGWETGDTDNTEGPEVPTDQEVYTFEGDVSTGGTITLDRGTKLEDLYIVASNVDYNSEPSNVFSLNDEWATPQFTQAFADPYTGEIYLQWRKPDANGKLSPDWGDPEAKYSVSIIDTTTDEETVYKDLSTTGELKTPVFAENARNPQQVVLHVTTSLGDEMDSEPIVLNFPRPGAPTPVKNIGFDKNGTGKTNPNRVTFEATTCVTRTVQYQVTDKNNGSYAWTTGTSIENGRIAIDLNSDWMKQGDTEDFVVLARCLSVAGTSDNSDPSTGSVNVGINTPPAPKVTNETRGDTVAISLGEPSLPNADLSAEYRVTVTKKNGGDSSDSFTTSDSSYVLNGLEPDTDQTVVVEVRYFNESTGVSSEWSPKTTYSWKTPKPAPGTPDLVLVDSAKKDSKNQNYTLKWNETTWADSYKIVNTQTGAVLATVNKPMVQTVITLERGIDPTKVAVIASNSDASSPRSEEVELYAPWATPKFLETKLKRDGSAYLRWANGSATDATPDWGNPDMNASWQIRRGSETGASVESATKGNALDVTTPIFANTSELRDEKYFAQITIQTSTGKTLKSAWTEVKFERPSAIDSATGVILDAGGSGATKPNRVLWDAAVCSQSNSHAEYKVGFTNAVANGVKVKESDLIAQGAWQSGTSYELTQAQLDAFQGKNVAAVVYVRCVFEDNGDKSTPSEVVAGGDAYASFVGGILKPTTNPGTPTRVSQKDNVISWSAAVCAPGTTVEYRLSHTKKNGTASTSKYTTTSTSYTLASISAGTDQSVQVQARCVSGINVSDWGPNSSAYNYKAPLPQPTAPAVTKVGTPKHISAIKSMQDITWTSVANAESYTVYIDGAVAGTYLSTEALRHPILLDRGDSKPARTAYVVATNFTWNVPTENPKSNTVSLNDPWDKLTDANISYTTDRKVTITWQDGAGNTRTPNWGNDSSKVDVSIYRKNGTLVTKVVDLTGNSYTSAAITGTDKEFYVIVAPRAADGTAIASLKKDFNFDAPLAPSNPGSVNRVEPNRDNNAYKVTGYNVKWNNATCSSGPNQTAKYRLHYVNPVTGTDTTIGAWTTNTEGTISSDLIPTSTRTGHKVYVEVRCDNTFGSSASAKTPVYDMKLVANNPSPEVRIAIAGNDGVNPAKITWTKATCDAGSTLKQNLYWFMKNGDIDTNATPIALDPAATSYDKFNSEATPGLAQSFALTSECVDAQTAELNSFAVPASADANGGMFLEFTLAYPEIKDVNNLRVVSSKINVDDPEYMDYTIAWDAQNGVSQYRVDSTRGEKASVNGNETTTTITLKRGNSASDSTTDIWITAYGYDDQKSASDRVNLSPVYSALKVVSLDASNTVDSKLSMQINWGTMDGSQLNVAWGNAIMKGITYKVTFMKEDGTKLIDSSASANVTGNTRLTSMDLPYGYSGKVQARVDILSGTTVIRTVTSTTAGTINTGTDDKVTGITRANPNSNTLTWDAVTCPGGTPAAYVVKLNGAVHSTVTSPSVNLGTLANNSSNTVSISVKCGNVLATTATEHTFTYLSGTNSIPAPALTANTNTLSWTDSYVCDTGATKSYVVTLEKFKGENPSPAFSTTVTGNFYTIPAAYKVQGTQAQWSVAVKCAGIGSGTGAKATSAVLTNPVIAMPTGALNQVYNAYITYNWNTAMTCPAGTSKFYRFNVDKLNNVDVANYSTKWVADTSGTGAISTQAGGKYGYTHKLSISVACGNDNAGNVIVGPATTGAWVEARTKLRQAYVEDFVATTAGASWRAACPIGTWYRWSYAWSGSTTTPTTWSAAVLDKNANNEYVNINKAAASGTNKYFHLKSECISEVDTTYTRADTSYATR